MQIPKWIITWLGALLIAFVGLSVISKGYEIGSKLNQRPENTISMSAEGRVTAVPDLATMNLGVLTQGDTASEVQDESSEKINQVIAFVKSQGVDESDIKTSQFSINPRYNFKDGENIIIGYEANQTVTVKIRNVNESSEMVSKILDGATKNGANQVLGVSLSFDDPDDLRQEARKKAIAAAKEKAQELAEEAGLRLGKIVSISESGSSYPVPYDESYARGLGGGGGPLIEPGTQDITENITVVFEVK
ncbi:MAG: SIMPL domain-containing protein [Candidatus Doudnabacteria bacterium]|nr:SIMPL domain-containing protein [Candidatus Doudnabacteria bacterium]